MGMNVCCSALQCVSVCCSVVQCVEGGGCASEYQSSASCHEVHKYVCLFVAVWCSVVHCSEVWCSVVQCGAVWCSVVQRVAVCCSASEYFRYPSYRAL